MKPRLEGLFYILAKSFVSLSPMVPDRACNEVLPELNDYYEDAEHLSEAVSMHERYTLLTATSRGSWDPK